MSEPVLTDGCNHIDLDLVFDILSVSVVRDLTGMCVRVAQNLVVHDGFILLILVGGVDVVLINNIQLGACVMDILKLHFTRVYIDVETFTTWREICSDTMTDRQVVRLGGNWSGQSSAEWVYHRWKTTVRL